MRALFLNGSLKPGKSRSNTDTLAQMVGAHLRRMGKIKTNFIRLADWKMATGTMTNGGKGDQYPEIEDRIVKADIVVFGTPIWWGNRSSVMQHLIERLDSIHSKVKKGAPNPLSGKVAGIVITGSEDGAQAVQGGMMEFLTWMGFLLPPECCCYWVGETGKGGGYNEILKSDAAFKMAKKMATNLAEWANK